MSARRVAFAFRLVHEIASSYQDRDKKEGMSFGFVSDIL
jgi:hypothetical protein